MAEHVTHSHAPDAPEHHGSGAYYLVWIALLVLTLVTVVTGRMDIPGFNLLIALVIASTKATLVVLFFMHLWEQKGVNRITFVASMSFVVIMLLGVFADITTRLETLLPDRNAKPTLADRPHGPAHPATDVSAPGSGGSQTH